VTAPTIRWLGNSDIIRQILEADPNAPGPTWSLGPSTIYAPKAVSGRTDIGTGVARYRSFDEFQAEVKTSTIDGNYHWVLYDPENWADTPVEEQQDPWTWLLWFGQYAHAHGYRVICAPARDLGLVVDSAMPKLTGEGLTQWYLRTAIAAFAAPHADILSVQSQALTEDPVGYAAFVNAARQQAKTVNPYVKVFAGISTRYGTAAQMATAARSVHVDGYWLNVPGPDPDIGKAVEFLHLMTGGQ
jgi:hypothetical protein